MDESSFKVTAGKVRSRRAITCFPVISARRLVSCIAFAMLSAVHAAHGRLGPDHTATPSAAAGLDATRSTSRRKATLSATRGIE